MRTTSSFPDTKRFSQPRLATAVLGCFLGGCAEQPPESPKFDGSTVFLEMRHPAAQTFELGPKSTALFLDMLTNQPVRSAIGQMPALPLGTFIVGTNRLLWHGNGVILGKGSQERLWHGPFLQRLAEEKMKSTWDDPGATQRILDLLENDPSVPSTPLGGPGQYPGGANNALNPTPFTIDATQPSQPPIRRLIP